MSKRWMTRVAAVGLMVMCLTAAATGFPLINIDFNDNVAPAEDYTGGAVVGSGYAGGVVGTGSDQWNYLESSGGTAISILNLVDSTGNPTGVNFSVTQNTTIFTNNRNGTSNYLLDDYLVVVGDSPSATFTISNLVPGLGYDLYLYSTAGSHGYGGTFTVDGNTKFSSGGWSGSYVENTNYVKFSIPADNAGVITGTWSIGNAYGILNGIQLIPEPATAWLLALAGGMIMLRRRR